MKKTTRPTFTNAPIVEAVIDLRVQPPDLSMERLSQFCESVADVYPKREDLKTWAGLIQLNPVVSVDAGLQNPALGLRVSSKDGLQVIQANPYGFTFSRLRPYLSWQEFSGEGRKRWEQFLAITKPSQITRLAVRYINKIEITDNRKKLSDYFLTFPQVGASLENTVTSFRMQLAVEKPEIAAVAIVTQFLELDPKTGKVSIVFDIDAFKNGEFDTSSERVWPHLEELRAFKNDVFFDSITEETQRMFA